MWTIGQSQHVEGKKYRPIVHKIRYFFFGLNAVPIVENSKLIPYLGL